jgi:hypothetical protein
MNVHDVRMADPEAFFAYERVLQAHPEFRPYVQVKTDADVPYLLVRVPASVPNHADLFIDTADGELTLAFDRWHQHFNFEEVESLLKLLDDILNERTIIVVKMDGDKWKGSTSLKVGADRTDVVASAEGKAYYRSWKGTYDLGEASLPPEPGYL